jgi:hypothetical protein
MKSPEEPVRVEFIQQILKNSHSDLPVGYPFAIKHPLLILLSQVYKPQAVKNI